MTKSTVSLISRGACPRSVTESVPGLKGRTAPVIVPIRWILISQNVSLIHPLRHEDSVSPLQQQQQLLISPPRSPVFCLANCLHFSALLSLIQGGDQSQERLLMHYPFCHQTFHLFPFHRSRAPALSWPVLPRPCRRRLVSQWISVQEEVAEDAGTIIKYKGGSLISGRSTRTAVDGDGGGAGVVVVVRFQEEPFKCTP